jgi:hypothetical protein
MDQGAKLSPGVTVVILVLRLCTGFRARTVKVNLRDPEQDKA